MASRTGEITNTQSQKTEGRGFKLQSLHPKKMSRLFSVCHVGNLSKWKAKNSRHAGRQNGSWSGGWVEGFAQYPNEGGCGVRERTCLGKNYFFHPIILFGWLMT